MTAKDQNGFTLIELIVACVITGLLIVAISTLYAGIQDTQRSTGYLEAATRAAQREVEVLRNNNYNGLTAGVPIDFSSDLPSTLPAHSTGSVAVTDVGVGLKQVDITVSYRDGSHARKVELTSDIGVLGIGQ